MQIKPALKKGFEYGDQGEKEHIWLTEVVLTAERYECEINNEPVDATYLQFGQKVVVQPDEISDWMFFDQGRLRGGYTIVALHYGTEDQPAYEKQLGIDYSRYKFLQNK